MDNKDEILRRLRELEYVTAAECRPLPEGIVDVMPEGSLTFYVHQFIAGAGINGRDRDNHAEIYVPQELYSNPECNEAIVQQMRDVLAQIELTGTPESTFEKDPIIPPVVVSDVTETATNE